MDRIETMLFDELTKAIEKKQQAEMELLIAEREYSAIQAAYRSYKGLIGKEVKEDA
jgi:hypothetical protein